MDNKNILIMYGSAEGNSESIAKRIHNEALDFKYSSKLIKLNDFRKDDIFMKSNIIIIVCSTTGDGDIPENATRFYTFIRRTKEKICTGKKYAILGLFYYIIIRLHFIKALGDSNYSNFCRAGKRIDARLLELGGEKFMERGDADDAVG